REQGAEDPGLATTAPQGNLRAESCRTPRLRSLANASTALTLSLLRHRQWCRGRDTERVYSNPRRDLAASLRPPLIRNSCVGPKPMLARVWSDEKRWHPQPRDLLAVGLAGTHGRIAHRGCRLSSSSRWPCDRPDPDPGDPSVPRRPSGRGRG